MIAFSVWGALIRKQHAFSVADRALLTLLKATMLNKDGCFLKVTSGEPGEDGFWSNLKDGYAAGVSADLRTPAGSRELSVGRGRSQRPGRAGSGLAVPGPPCGQGDLGTSFQVLTGSCVQWVKADDRSACFF